MRPGPLYTVGPDGGLQRMEPSAPQSEDRMQALVARYPELIADGDGELLLIRREQAIGDSEESAGRWSLDHLFVTRDAVPVLVELKRAADTRLRREVVGQMLDYAANATAYWQSGRIAASHARSAVDAGQDPDLVLQAFLDGRDPETFWAQVDANFKAGRIKLVFVADEIPAELARIVEFMNEQMRADVRAVELRWFASDSGAITLNPRIIGETERTALAKRSAPLEPLSREEWLRRRFGERKGDTLAGAHAFVAMIEKLSGEAGLSSGQGSIYAAFVAPDGKTVYPFHLWADGCVSFTLRYLHTRPGLDDETLRLRLMHELAAIVGPLTTMNTRGYPSFNAAALANPETSAAVEPWMSSVLACIESQPPLAATPRP